MLSKHLENTPVKLAEHGGAASSCLSGTVSDYRKLTTHHRLLWGLSL